MQSYNHTDWCIYVSVFVVFVRCSAHTDNSDGSLVLVGGDPGAGKSTMLPVLQRFLDLHMETGKIATIIAENGKKLANQIRCLMSQAKRVLSKLETEQIVWILSLINCSCIQVLTLRMHTRINFWQSMARIRLIIQQAICNFSY
ncbi:hypothetical protein CTI12_AA274970 [Artemisia annua]|uniref:Uncharacterized protein n=1 Tax=Artemisia annua TaxID=35608 RepID=A0A2U1NCT1_ARTAN|nr:hypothetical protein CTI12_AA274970 [Artemisia annua]